MNLRESLNKIDTGALSGLLRKARLNPREIAFLVAALLFIVAAAIFFLTKVEPLNSQVTALQARATELRKKLKEINDKEKRQSEQTINAEKILNSLDQFESNLKPDESGMTQIINEIDALGKTHKILTGNASYRVEEAANGTDGNVNPAPQTTLNNKGNTYPALGIETTVTGDYPNLRRFLIDLERSKQFLIIRSLSFQGEDRGRLAANAGRPGPQLSSPEAIPVSLKIEFDTYFRKPSKRGQ